MYYSFASHDMMALLDREYVEKFMLSYSEKKTDFFPNCIFI